MLNVWETIMIKSQIKCLLGCYSSLYLTSSHFSHLSGSWGSVYNTVQRAGLIGSSGLSYEVLIHEAMRMRVTVTANK